MSLILEALKRSEKERQQKAHAVTDTVYLEREPTQRKPWVYLLLGLTIINVLIVGIFAWLTLTQATETEDQLANQSTSHITTSTNRITGTLPAPPIFDEPLPSDTEEFFYDPAESIVEVPAVSVVSEPSPVITDSLSNSVRDYHSLSPGLRTQLDTIEINTIVYSDSQQKRFALINMQRYRENDSLPFCDCRLALIEQAGITIDTEEGQIQLKPDY
jgi:hypothetical protein